MNPLVNANLENKLTSAARRALDELVEDYRNQVLLGAIQAASSVTGEVQEISIRDILSGMTRSRIKTNIYLNREERLAQIGLFAGIVYAILGFGFVIFQGNLLVSPSQLIGYSVGFAGIILSMFSYFYPKLRRPRYSTQAEESQYGLPVTNLSLLFIQQWQRIELTARNIIALRSGESSANKPISLLVEELRQNGDLNSDEEKTLRELLDFRNRIIHGGFNPRLDTITSITRRAEKLLAKLESVPMG